MSTSDRNPLVHGSNLEQKEVHRTKYRDSDSKKYLKEIRAEYDKWHSKNIKLVEPTSTPTDNDDTILTHLFYKVRKHLTTDWSGGIEQGIKRGWLIDE